MRATTLLAGNTAEPLSGICAQLTDAGVPTFFDRDEPFDSRLAAVRSGEVDVVWACGLLTAELIDEDALLDPIGIPELVGLDEGRYHSMIVARDGLGEAEGRRGRLAVNEYGSWSGWHAYRVHRHRAGGSVDEHRSIVLTGGHEASLAAMRSGVADVASIDSSVWATADKTALHVVEETARWPAPPVSVRSDIADEVRDVLRSCLPWAAQRRDFDDMLTISRSPLGA